MKVLMSPPHFFGIRYEINPWMKIENEVDSSAATAQWNTIYERYVSLGVEVTIVDPQPLLPDMVFTANGGIVIANKAILPNFTHPERQPETAYFKTWFDAQRFESVFLPQDMTFEGEGDCLLYKDFYLCGYGFRSDPRVAEHFRRSFGVKAIPIHLINPYFYHIDTCLLPLQNALVYYPGAFSQESREKLHLLTSHVYELNDAEAQTFSANSTVIGNVVVGNIQSPRLLEFLDSQGYTVLNVQTSEFIKSGGSVKCLTLLLD